MTLRTGGIANSDLLCPIPGCSGTLYLEMSGCVALGVPSKEWPQGAILGQIPFSAMNTTTWQVICDYGHTVGVPENSADDYAEPFMVHEFIAKFDAATPGSLREGT